MRKSRMFATVLVMACSAWLWGQELKIHHIDVGQGDATLIVTPSGKTVLIDAGNNGKGTGVVLPYLSALAISSLDYVINTHYHADHLGGLDEVISGLGGANVGTVYDRGTAHTVPTTVSYTSYASAAATATGGRHAASVGQVINVGDGVSLLCLAVDGNVLNYGTTFPGSSFEENDVSTAFLLSYGDFRYFTGGDIGGESSYYYDQETPVAQVSGVGQVDGMKVNHHGSQYSSNQLFVDTLNPTVAEFEVGSNTYGHPVQAVLNRFAAAGAKMYLTETGSGGALPAGSGWVAGGSIVMSTSGHGTFTVSFGSTTHSYGLHRGAVPCDLNLDRTCDIIWRNNVDGMMSSWYINGSGVIGGGYLGGISDLVWQLAGTGDLNGDGVNDLLWRRTDTGEMVVWFVRGDGTGISGALSLGTVDPAWRIVGLGDADGDGKADLFWRNDSNGMMSLWFLTETGVKNTGYIGGISSTDWKVVGVADFNGDRKKDIFWRHQTTGAMSIWFVNENGYAGAVSPGTVDPVWKIVGLGDADADGRADLFWRNDSNGMMSLWFIDENGYKNNAYVGGIASTDWQVKGIGDFNGDGKADILWRNMTDGAMSIWFVNQTGYIGAMSPGVVGLDWQIQNQAGFIGEGVSAAPEGRLEQWR